jgi:anti-sigma regulatory factor (Ser/Thr protein kinase)
MQTELILPNDPRCLNMARNYVQELCALADIKSDEAHALVLAADEACTNTIEHAFEPGEEGAYAIKSEITPLALTLAIHDRGLPFDASLAPTYRPPADLDEASTRGLGLYLIRQAADEVQWLNHGREGKELRLTKYRRQSDVTAQLTAAELAPFREDEPLAPPQEYTLRWLKPEETIWVSQCIYRAYGRTHPSEYLYYPERMAHMLEAREIIASAVVGEEGDLAGFAIGRPGHGRVAELHEVAVVPRHRGRGLMKRLNGLLEDDCRNSGVAGMFVEAVTNHLFTQKVVAGQGFRDCGLTIGSAPESQHFKGIDPGAVAQRGSWTLAFKYLNPPAAARAYAPDHHRAMLGRIYEHIGIPVEWQDPAAQDTRAGQEGPGKVVVSYYPTWGFGEIEVEQPGTETAAEIRRGLRDLCDLAGAQAVYLHLPLAQPETPALCCAAENDGFFFSGVGPEAAPEGDMLRLQFLNTTLDTSQIHLLDPFAKDLLAYIDRERARVAQ